LDGHRSPRKIKLSGPANDGKDILGRVGGSSDLSMGDSWAAWGVLIIG
jgi:hypothetical protein